MFGVCVVESSLMGGVSRSIGNELTPSAKYDFKFKDYAPWVFRELREDCFHLDPADYLLSLTAQYILSELGSPGKSGSFFYFSRDYRFIIKTIRHAEHKFLRSILKRYHAHIRANPHTLLSRFYGLHRVKLPRGRKIHFVIMNNLFPAHKDIHESYDLKGSTVGRLYPEERALENPRAVLKDLNWIDRNKELEFGPEKRALLTEQLRRDAELLKELCVMDYSLLVGIHNMQRGNRDNVRRNTLRVFSPPEVHVPPQPHAHGGLHRRRATTTTTPEKPHVVRRAVHRNANANLKSVDDGVLPEEDTGDRQHFLFCQDEGGLRATDEQNLPLGTVYYLGIIDILTPYGIVKKVEHLWKGMSADRVRPPFPSLPFSELARRSGYESSFWTRGVVYIAQDQPGAAGRIRGPFPRIYARDHAWWWRRGTVQGRINNDKSASLSCVCPGPALPFLTTIPPFYQILSLTPLPSPLSRFSLHSLSLSHHA